GISLEWQTADNQLSITGVSSGGSLKSGLGQTGPCDHCASPQGNNSANSTAGALTFEGCEAYVGNIQATTTAPRHDPPVGVLANVHDDRPHIDTRRRRSARHHWAPHRNHEFPIEAARSRSVRAAR